MSRLPLLSTIPHFNPKSVPKQPRDMRFGALSPAQLQAQHIQKTLAPTLALTHAAAQEQDPGQAHIPSQPGLKPSAVLIPLMQHEEGLTLLLTQRSTLLKKHSGQIALPGGKIDPEDANATQTALREAQEEIGLPPSHCQIIGKLPRHETGTGFEITPIVALVNPDFTPVLSAQEVSAIFEIPLVHVMNPMHHDFHELTWTDDQGTHTRNWFAMPSTDTQGVERFVWGVTARVLRDLYEFLHGDLRTHTRR